MEIIETGEYDKKYTFKSIENFLSANRLKFTSWELAYCIWLKNPTSNIINKLFTDNEMAYFQICDKSIAVSVTNNKEFMIKLCERMENELNIKTTLYI